MHAPLYQWEHITTQHNYKKMGCKASVRYTIFQLAELLPSLPPTKVRQDEQRISLNELLLASRQDKTRKTDRNWSEGWICEHPQHFCSPAVHGEGHKVQVEFNCCQLIKERIVASDRTRKEIEIKDPKEDKLTFGTGLEDSLRLEEGSEALSRWVVWKWVERLCIF